MAFSVRDKATDDAVRKLARLTGKGLTDTIRDAVERELKRIEKTKSVEDRIREIQERFARYPLTGLKADKEFYDSLNDE